MINISKNSYWNLIFAIMTTNVYLTSEVLQLSPWISSNSHNNPTVYTFGYNLLYSWLITFIVIKMSEIISEKPPNIPLYYFFYILGALGFALLGEVSFLKGLAIVPGFWKHLNGNAKLTIIVFAIFIIILGIIQLKQAIKDKDFCKHFLSYLLFIIFYGITLMTLIMGQAANLYIHVHHAICASLLSFWFTDWNSKSSMIFHAILMGVVVEGIDFYGIGELSLFLCNMGNIVQFAYALVIASTFFILTVPVLLYFNCHKNYFIKKNNKASKMYNFLEN